MTSGGKQQGDDPKCREVVGGGGLMWRATLSQVDFPLGGLAGWGSG